MVRFLKPQGAPRTNQELAEEARVSVTTVKRAKQSVRENKAGREGTEEPGEVIEEGNPNEAQ